MTRSIALGCAMALVVGLAGACSSSTPDAGTGATPAPTSTSGTSSTPLPGTSGSSAGVSTGGTSSGGSAAAGGTETTTAGATTMAGTGSGGQAPTGGSAGAATAGGGVGGGGGSGGTASAGGKPPEGPFTCTQYFGAYLTMEWWNSGFEQKVDNAKWQLKWHHHGHVSEWSKPDSPFWANDGDPMDDTKGAPIQSKCAANSDTPDRVVFLMIDWELLTEKAWLDGMTAVIANVKAKLPSVKRVDIQNYVRCPNNMMCNPGANYGPGADDSAAVQDCYVPDYEDSAYQKLVDADPTFVALGPKLQMAACNPAHNGAHMTAEGNTQAAVDMAAYYSMHL